MNFKNSAIAASLALAALCFPSPGLAAASDRPATRAASSDGLWREVDESSIARRQERQIVPLAYRSLSLDANALRSRLAKAPMEDKRGARASDLEMTLPMPDGSFARFRVVESPIMAPELAAKFPEIKTYLGQGIDDPGATLRFDLTPFGFHGQILSSRGSSYIDPYQRGDSDHYIAYAKRDLLRQGPAMQCLVGDDADSDHLHDLMASANPSRDASTSAVSGGQSSISAISSGTTLHTYRLAVAATGEYTAFHGGTVSGGMSGIVTTMNRVNGIYERDVSVRMVLVANNNLLIYTNAATDPYANTSGDLDANQNNVNTVIGSGNYDVGHLVGTGGGGIAQLRSPCGTGKARGLTGSPAPVGDAFDVDYVAHEMGHQFGGNHTFNGSQGSCTGGNRNASTAYEPGSGITIQAYAGICGVDNLQPNSEDYFHRVSLDEILAFTTTGTGTCSVNTATGNTPPTVTAPADVTIPAQTPFALTAVGSDANGDALTYLWEEFDLGGTFAGGALSDNGASPIFRSYAPTLSPTREFPSVRFQLANGNAPPATSALPGTTTPLLMTGEVLPTTTRAMKFRVTVRDNRAGGGGTNDDEIIVNTVSTAGPFAVTAPNTAVSWAAGSSQTVTWSVASTDIAPISTANVSIKLSTDGGNSYPVVLAASVPNNGSANITVPANTPATLQARVRVEAVGNIFFDISNANFTITSANTAPTITVTGSLTTRQGSPSSSANVATVADANSHPITVSLADVPPELTASVINSSGTVQLTAAAACSLVSPSSSNKVYPLTLLATDSQGGTASASVNVNVGSNLMPTLGTYANKLTFPSSSSSVTPSVAPSDGSNNLTGVSVSPTTLPGGGTVSINPTTGVVSITTVAGTTLGAYPISVTATDSCGAVRIVTFTLTVSTPDPVLSLASSTVTSGNALIEPNECNTLNLTLANGGGSTATAVSSTLSSTTPGVTIAQPTSAYGNLAVDAQGVNTTPFQVSTASSVQCFSNIALRQTVTYTGGGSPAILDFTLPVGTRAANYTVASSTGATIPEGGAFLTGSDVDDEVFALTVPSGFNFSAYNTNVTGGSTISVSTNGNVQLVSSGASTRWTNLALPTAGNAGDGGTTAFPASAPVLFPYWDDLTMDRIGTGGIYTQVVGTAPNRQWIIEWRAKAFGETATAPTTQVALVLKENSPDFEYRYVLTSGGTAANGAKATIGSQAATTGTSFTQHSFNTASVPPGTVLSFTLPFTCSQGTGVCGVAPTPALSIADASVTEGNGGAKALNFTVTLSSAAPAGGVTFDIATVNARSTGNTALAGSDYVAASLTGVTIAAGQTSKTFTVKIYGDTRVEQDEMFLVSVSNVANATVTRATAIGSIVNDDAASVLSLADDAAPSSLSIASVQGNGLMSAFAGRPVIVRGIVTAVTREGFFLQSPDSGNDADRASSEGIFVFTGEIADANAKVGNSIDVRGQVQEATTGTSRHALSLTRIAAAEITLLATGQTLPKPVILDASELAANRDATWLERYEGMRVTAPRLTVVAPTGGRIDDSNATATSDGNFYGVASGTARPFREPGIHVLEPSLLRAGVNPPMFDGNPERLQVDSLAQTGARTLAVDTGDTVTGLVGVLGHGQGAYALLADPQARVQVTAAAAPRAVTTAKASEITIGHFNARRFFDDNNHPKQDEPVLTASAYALRLAKTANAICAYARSPDILGVAEVENLSTLSDLAGAINDKAGNVLFPEACSGSASYRAHGYGKGVAGDGSLGVLVNTANVRPGVPRVQVLSTQALGKAIRFSHPDGSSEVLFDQAPLLMQARINKAGGSAELLTVIFNQLRSADGIDDESPGHHGWATQADYVRAKRRVQAQQLALLLQSRQSTHRRERTVVLGGFESNEFSDGQDDLMGLLTGKQASRSELLVHADSPVNPPLVNLTLRMPQAERYSVTREGNAEAVDHVLANQALVDGRYRLRTEYARINADFGEDNTGDFSVPLRVSGHDIVVLYLGEP